MQNHGELFKISCTNTLKDINLLGHHVLLLVLKGIRVLTNFYLKINKMTLKMTNNLVFV